MMWKLPMFGWPTAGGLVLKEISKGVLATCQKDYPDHHHYHQVVGSSCGGASDISLT